MGSVWRHGILTWGFLLKADMRNYQELAEALQPLVSRVRTDVTAVKKDGVQAWTREPLTDQRLAKHLNGGPARGVCPIKAGESVTMVALLDLDSHKGESTWEDMALAARAVCSELEARFLAPIPFRSSGGRGIHIFMLWDEPQDAYSVRCELIDALGAMGFSNGTKGVKYAEIEVFPKQDSVPHDGFGNQFILPLAGHSEPLDENMDPVGKDAVLVMGWPSSAPVPVRERPVREALAVEASGDLARLQAALDAIPNSGDSELDYDTWRNMIFAIHRASGGSDEGREIARVFSARSSKHNDAFFEERVWPYIRDRDGGVTEQTIYAKAREHGWDAPSPEEFPHEESAAHADEYKVTRKGIPEAKHLTTDQANAGRIVSLFGKRLIVVAGQWHAWTGKRWEKDDGEVYRYACRLSRIIHAEADKWLSKPTTSAEEKERNGKIAEALTRWAQKSEMKSSIEAAVGLAKKMLTVSEDMIDRNPWLLNCNNGVVDLRTGELRPHDPDDFITKIVSIDYEPTAKAPSWEAVLARVTLEEGTTKPLALFMQRWFGYCATGSTREQQFVVHYGAGSNGKSTILDTVAEILGDYAGTAAPGLMVSNAKDRHPTEIADLFGRRMVTAHEANEGGQLREDFVKQATGGDKIKARFMRADFFEFNPTHKLQLLTNHKPIIKGQDNGIWRRVLLVPYAARFASPEEVTAGRAHWVKDTTIMERLKNEHQGILSWIINGARAWFQDGLQPPDSVLAASKDYQREQDRVGQFLEECCECGRDFETTISGEFGGVYDTYRAWCAESGTFALSKIKLIQELERCVPFFAKRETQQLGHAGKRRKVVVVRGLRVLES